MLVPVALLNGIVGVLLVAGASGEALALGRLLVQQGVFLCLVVGVGMLVLPLIGGGTPPADLDRSPLERRRLMLYLALGLGIVLLSKPIAA